MEDYYSRGEWSGGCQKEASCPSAVYSTVQYSTVQYSTVQYSTVQYLETRGVAPGLRLAVLHGLGVGERELNILLLAEDVLLQHGCADIYLYV